MLTRCARSEAIPTFLRDLRSEWAGARQKGLADTKLTSSSLQA
jgi:hypothetical protein